MAISPQRLAATGSPTVGGTTAGPPAGPSPSLLLPGGTNVLPVILPFSYRMELFAEFLSRGKYSTAAPGGGWFVVLIVL
jgi:hypothetical protein